MNRKKAFTLVELLVVIAIIALLIGLLLPALAKASANAKSLKDKTQIQQIHKAALVFAADNKGRLPTPGLINRKSDTTPGVGLGNVPGMGAEDFGKNHTAHLYSAMIAQGAFKPEMLIGTTEVNSNIVQKLDYNYNAFQPASDVYWDGDVASGGALTNASFKCDPSASPCHASYSHLALCGARKRNEWRDNQQTGLACFGTRGTGGTYMGHPYGGQTDGDEYRKSPTLELHGPKQQWWGHVVFNDNHAETLQNFFASATVYMPVTANSNTVKDNIYAAEFIDYPPSQYPGGGAQGEMASGDSWLVMSVGATTNGNGITPTWDPIN